MTDLDKIEGGLAVPAKLEAEEWEAVNSELLRVLNEYDLHDPDTAEVVAGCLVSCSRVVLRNHVDEIRAYELIHRAAYKMARKNFKRSGCPMGAIGRKTITNETQQALLMRKMFGLTNFYDLEHFPTLDSVFFGLLSTAWTLARRNNSRFGAARAFWRVIVALLQTKQ